MGLIPDAPVVTTWLATADMPLKRSFGIAVSPDGSTLYVSCCGTGAVNTNASAMTDGGVLAIDIATQNISTIASARTWMRHGIDCDSSGIVYWADNTGAYEWDGSSSTAWSGGGWLGMTIHGDRLFKHVGRPHEYQLDGTSVGAFGTNLGGTGTACRGIAVNDDWAVYNDTDGGQSAFYDRNTGTTYTRSWVGSAPIGLAMVSNVEGYSAGHTTYTIARFNPSTRGVTGLTPASNPSNRWSDIVFTPAKDRCFVAAGGMSPVGFSANTDRVVGSDVGILEIDVRTLRPTVGYIGLG